MGRLTANCPKALLTVRGKALIRYPIEAMVAARIREIAVVVGYMADQIKAALGDGSMFGATIDYIFNDDYLGGNAISVMKARDWSKQHPFVLCMSDHIIEPGFIARSLDAAPVGEVLGVDFLPRDHHQLDEATKVFVDSNGLIRDIGKVLTDWNGLDTGVFLLTDSFFNAIEELVPTCGINVEISDVIRSMAGRECQFVACDVTGSFWTDVDTEEDLNFVTA